MNDRCMFMSVQKLPRKVQLTVLMCLQHQAQTYAQMHDPGRDAAANVFSSLAAE